MRDPDTGLFRYSSEHFDFLQMCKTYWEIETHFFVHANYDAMNPLADQDEYTLLWPFLDNQMPGRHGSGKIAVVGHTPQRNGEILYRGHLICIDTYCHGGGWLTAMDVRSNHTWQVNKHGMLRQYGENC